MPGTMPVRHLHFGGGTPTVIDPQDLGALFLLHLATLLVILALDVFYVAHAARSTRVPPRVYSTRPPGFIAGRNQNSRSSKRCWRAMELRKRWSSHGRSTAPAGLRRTWPRRASR